MEKIFYSTESQEELKSLEDRMNEFKEVYGIKSTGYLSVGGTGGGGISIKPSAPQMKIQRVFLRDGSKAGIFLSASEDETSIILNNQEYFVRYNH